MEVLLDGLDETRRQVAQEEPYFRQAGELDCLILDASDFASLINASFRLCFPDPSILAYARRRHSAEFQILSAQNNSRYYGTSQSAAPSGVPVASPARPASGVRLHKPAHNDDTATSRNTRLFSRHSGQASLRHRIRVLRKKGAARAKNTPSSTPAAPIGIDSLPDELIAKILKMAQLEWMEMHWPLPGVEDEGGLLWAVKASAVNIAQCEILRNFSSYVADGLLVWHLSLMRVCKRWARIAFCNVLTSVYITNGTVLDKVIASKPAQPPYCGVLHDVEDASLSCILPFELSTVLKGDPPLAEAVTDAFILYHPNFAFKAGRKEVDDDLHEEDNLSAPRAVLRKPALPIYQPDPRRIAAFLRLAPNLRKLYISAFLRLCHLHCSFSS